MLVNGRVHNTFVNKKAFLYYGIYLGFEMNNSTDKYLEINEKEKKFSIAALGGHYNSKNFYSGSTAFGAEFSYDKKSDLSKLLNYIHSNSSYSQNFLTEDFSVISNYFNTENDITGGVRFYLTGNRVRIFAENYVGIYLTDNVYENSVTNPTGVYNYTYATPENFFGISFGTGVDFQLINNLSGMVKVDVGTYFRNSYYSGLFGGLKYRF
ncbi:MAG: hypothetical protein M3R36_15425 [Bacteroidota bacterium]|nr:hypothetical protein [Bacteroidota bacterium]